MRRALQMHVKRTKSLGKLSLSFNSKVSLVFYYNHFISQQCIVDNVKIFIKDTLQIYVLNVSPKFRIRKWADIRNSKCCKNITNC